VGEVLVPTGYGLIGQAAPFGLVSHERIGNFDPRIGRLGACRGPGRSPFRTFQLDLAEYPAFFVGLEEVEDATSRLCASTSDPAQPRDLGLNHQGFSLGAYFCKHLPHRDSL
jgi:hypothetical protein